MQSKGFTLIEILVALAIFIILAIFLVLPFMNLNRRQALTGSTLIVKSALSEARSKTVASEGDKQYGIHFPASGHEIVVFQGNNYSDGDSQNVSIDLHSVITIDSVNLSGGGNDVVFDRISGATSDSGEIVLMEDNNGAFNYATVTVFGTGVVE